MPYFSKLSSRVSAAVRTAGAMALAALVLQSFVWSPTGQVSATSAPPQTNPPLLQACGLDVALIVDVSGSIEQSEMTQVKSALTGFANAFDGTPTVFSLSKFSQTASVVEPFSLTPAEAAAAVQGQIPSAGSGYTNWDDGLAKGYSTFDPRTAKQNLIVIATDGNPNRWGSSGSSTGGTSAALSKAVERADDIKAAGTRIIAIGIGGGSDPLNVDNLTAITGPKVAPPNAIDTTVDVITSDFNQLGQVMRSLADSLCGGKILVQKQFDTDGDSAPDADGSAPDPLLSGYTFEVSGSPAQVTTDTGALEFEVLNGTYELAETDLPSGTHLIDIACQKGQQDVGIVDLPNRTVSGLVMGSDETIVCRFVNAYDAATIVVEKHVINDDGGTKTAADFTMHVSAVNPSQSSFPGDEAGVAVTVQPGQYDVTEDSEAGYVASLGADCSGSIAAGETRTCVITNNDVDEPLEEVPVATCTGAGEAYLFRGNQFQAIDATFQVQRDRLLVFTRGDYLDSLSVSLNGSPAVPVLIKNITSPFPVKIYQVATSAGDVVHVTGASDPSGLGARAIQGFLAQDASAPAYDISTLQVIFDDAQVNEMYLTPGSYSYVFFDKYTLNNDGTDDSRQLSVEIAGPGGTLADETYTKPAPVGTQGAVIGSFTVGSAGEGMYELAISTQDSVYWPKAVCPVPTATIIVKKHVINDNNGTKQAADFTMNVSAVNPSQTSFPGDEAGVAVSVNPGAYSVDETAVSGYSKTLSAECSGTIYGGQTKICTITNNDIEPQVCRLEIEKSVNAAVAQPGDTLTYTLNFRNVGNIPCTGGGVKVQDVVDPRLQYLSETHTSNVDAGYNGPVYQSGTLRWNAHELIPGESGQVVWTARIKEMSACGQFDIPNTAQITARELNWQWTLSNTVHTVGEVMCRATLIVKKFVINDDGGTKVAADFTMNVAATDAQPSSFAGSGVGTVVTLTPGSYSVDETADPDYAKTASSDCSGTIAHNETKICTITNDDIPPEDGKLIVVKHVINDNGGTKVAADFDIEVNASGNFQTTIPGDETGTELSVQPGAYRVEEPDSLGYSVTYSSDCVGTIGEAETKTCVVTNDDPVPPPPDPSYVIVIKHVSNDDGGTKLASDFTMHLSAGSGSLTTSFPGVEAPGVQTQVPVGDFSVSEDTDAAYTMTMAGDCSGTIAVGETKTCTITNDDIPPPPPEKGKLVFIKHVINDDGGTNLAADFSILVQAAGGYQNTFAGKEAPGDMADVDPGAYTIDETDSLGYSKTLSADCSGTVAAGETKTCTITNDDPSDTKLIVIKHVINNNSGTKQAADFTMNVTAVNPSQTSFPGSEAGVTVSVEPGDYSVNESDAFNYTKTLGNECSGTIAAGETKTCVITNDDPSGGGGGGGGCTGASCNPSPSPVNASLTCSPNAVLSLTYGSDVRSISISNAADFSGATTISPTPSLSWSADPGTAVYVKFERFTGSIEIRTVQATACGQVLGEQCIDVAAARDAVSRENASVVNQYRGRLVTAPTGELWYVDQTSGYRYYMQFGFVTYDLARVLATGMSNADLATIPVGVSSGFGSDSDSDGLSDALESAIGTDLSKTDSDGDGYDDRTEVMSGYNPLGAGSQPIALDFAQQKRGMFLVQVEGKGELWYVDPVSAKRYLVPAGEDTAEFLRGLAIPVDESVLGNIKVGIEANGVAFNTVSICYPPVSRVLGITDELPRTGLPTGLAQLLVVPLIASYPYLQRRYRSGLLARYYRSLTN